MGLGVRQGYQAVAGSLNKGQEDSGKGKRLIEGEETWDLGKGQKDFRKRKRDGRRCYDCIRSLKKEEEYVRNKEYSLGDQKEYVTNQEHSV